MLQLYNDNARLGVEVQKKEDEYAELMMKLTHIEPFAKKYAQLRDDYDILEAEIKMLKQQNIEDTNRVQRAENKVKELERENVSLKHSL